MTRDSNNQSIERADSLLRVLAGEEAGLKVGDLAKHTGLGQSTVSRMLRTLEDLEYVERDGHTGLYQLGPALIELAGVALNQIAVYRESRQIAQNLASSLRIGANVGVRTGAVFSYLLNVDGDLAPRSYTLMGRKGPLHATAIGKALCSEIPAEELAHLIADFPPLTPRTITSLADYEDALATVRSRGYATEVEELAFGRACIAAPVRDRSDAVVAGISLSGPLTVLALDDREDDLARQLIEAADLISTKLGYYAKAPGSARSHV